MNLKKAIEILQSYLRGDEPDYDPDLPDAIRLGIEALKRVKYQHDDNEFVPDFLLPGETED